MAKKNKQDKDRTGVDLVRMLTERTSKKGKIRGSKKEKRMTKLSCPHHRYKGNKGKKVATIVNDGKGQCRCTVCGAVFPADFVSKKEVQKRIHQVTTLAEQTAFVNQVVGGGKKTAARIAKFNIDAHDFVHLYENEKKVAQKQENMHKKKKKGHNKYKGSQMGGYGPRY